MIVRVDVERTEYGHIYIEVEDYDEAEQIVNDADFDSYDVIREDSNWSDGWVANLDNIAIVDDDEWKLDKC